MKRFDLIEIVLKKELDIKLSEDELIFYDGIDNDIKETIVNLLNDFLYSKEINRAINNILSKSNNYSPEQYKEIKEKCEAKKNKILLLDKKEH